MNLGWLVGAGAALVGNLTFNKAERAVPSPFLSSPSFVGVAILKAFWWIVECAWVKLPWGANSYIVGFKVRESKRHNMSSSSDVADATVPLLSIV